MPFLGAAIFLVWLILLLRFPRTMLPVSGVLAAIGLLLGLGVGFMQWQQAQRLDQLEFALAYQPQQCEFGKPLTVRIRNQSEYPVQHIRWQLIANQPGYNTNLLDAGVAQEFSSAARLQPGEQRLLCYSVPRLRRGYREAELEYRVEAVNAEFIR
ncbi:MAG: multidrug transporter [Halopseudomonas sp.]|uniref:multidrug transporter n=1 Tax=Halopseudomonas sp. TaxID=2901191 RepID=UPI003002F3A9